jgi:uncharacterized protein YqeY
MTLKDQIQAAMKDALRGGDKRRLGALRLMLAAIKQREIDERSVLDETQVLVVLDKMAKQRRESISQYRQANRDDLADQEAFELELIQSFLPEPLEEAELDALIEEALKRAGAATLRDMGKVMGVLKPRIQGRADLAAVSARIKARLG